MKRGGSLRRRSSLKATSVNGRKRFVAADKANHARARHKATREAVFARDGACLIANAVAAGYDSTAGECGGRLRTYHHLRKAGQGGTYTELNGVTLCSVHNDWVEDHPTLARHVGLVVMPGITFEEAADRRRYYGLVPR